MSLGDVSVTVGRCIGIAVASTASTSDRLMARADSALHEAKSTGRNTDVIAPDLPQGAAPPADGAG